MLRFVVPALAVVAGTAISATIRNWSAPLWLRTTVVSVAAAAITGGIVVVVILALRPERTTETAKATGSAVTVETAASAGQGKVVAVRGFVFLDEQVGALLCSQRTTARRPACAGSSLVLDGIDTSRLDLVRAEQTTGGYDAWARTAVTLLGRVDRATLTVQDIINP